MRNNLKIVASIVMLFASLPAAQGLNMSKRTGPSAWSFFYTGYNNEFQSYSFNGYLTITAGGTTKNPTLNLRYDFSTSSCDWWAGVCTNLYEQFEGPIPAGSLTYSGSPEWNGSFRIELNVDTRLIDASPAILKTGTGGGIHLTWDQDPTSQVARWTGAQTFEDLMGRSKENGWIASMSGSTTGTVWLLPYQRPWSSIGNSMQWLQLTDAH